VTTDRGVAWLAGKGTGQLISAVGDGASGAARCLPGPEGFHFAGSDDGVERAAATYALTGSAKLNSLDPELCLRQVLERIADHPIQRISELLPWNISLRHRPTLSVPRGLIDAYDSQSKFGQGKLILPWSPAHRLFINLLNRHYC
jgi:hypothetical protein